MHTKSLTNPCVVPGCTKKKVHFLGLCETHLQEGIGFQHTIKPTEERTTTCHIEGCNRPIRAKGLCHSHHAVITLRINKMKKGKEYFRSSPTCTIEGCLEPTFTKNYCKQHYSKVRYANIRAVELQNKRLAPLTSYCSVVGCYETPYRDENVCFTHYEKKQTT